MVKPPGIMNKWKYLFLLLLSIWLISLIGIFICGQRSGWNRAQIDWDNPPAFVVLPSIRQPQMKIGAKVDGVWGKETDMKYDEYVGNQCLSKWFEPDGLAYGAWGDKGKDALVVR